jgi:hypothetical protein
MNKSWLWLVLGFAEAAATEHKIVVHDDESQPLAGAAVEITLAPPDDPRSASFYTLRSLTDSAGLAKFKSPDGHQAIRVAARQAQHLSADADHRHGLEATSTELGLDLTLPKEVPGRPLCYKDVRLSARQGNLPLRHWVDFDLAIGDAVAPLGKGQTSDLSIWHESTQNGWTESPEEIAELRRTPEIGRLSEGDFAETYGRFQGVTKIRFNQSGAGILRTPSFWAYCPRPLPCDAPLQGYVANLEQSFDTLFYPDENADQTGFFLRLRPTLGSDGQISSAHYAKIHGRIATGPGWVRFRYYYNPRADDRQLVFAPGRNLLRPSGAKGDDPERYETSQR